MWLGAYAIIAFILTVIINYNQKLSHAHFLVIAQGTKYINVSHRRVDSMWFMMLFLMKCNLFLFNSNLFPQSSTIHLSSILFYPLFLLTKPLLYHQIYLFNLIHLSQLDQYQSLYQHQTIYFVLCQYMTLIFNSYTPWPSVNYTTIYSNN